MDVYEQDIGVTTKQPEKTETKSQSTGGQVLLFPARTPQMESGRIFYLLSVRQVAEVLQEPRVQAVPFGPRHAEGVAQWRGRVLPVLCLEDCLGIEKTNASMPLRTIVVRSVTSDNTDQLHETYAIFTVGAAVRQLALPFDYEPLAMPAWVSNTDCLSGVYKMQDHYLLALNIDRIISAEISES